MPHLRRPAAWLALGAMLASLAMPAHASPVRGSGVLHTDLCVGGKVVPATPAANVADCEACCVSTSASPAVEGETLGVVPFMPPRASVATGDTPRAAARTFAQARAPPLP
jgi:hypothetical protein